MNEWSHSVRLDEEKCKGCINCIKRCPTEAIRVRNGKAHILSERCVDCGECIRVCPHHAKLPEYDPLSALDRFRYKVALPAPSLYAQFHNLDDVEIVLRALRRLGFDAVFEVSAAAEIVSEYTRRLLADGALPRPVISSACPAVTRLIRVRFPELIPHLLPVKAPVEVAAALARARAADRSGLAPEEIGVAFISPCAAKHSAAQSPLGLTASGIDCVLGIKDLYPLLLSHMKEAAAEEGGEELALSGRIGLSWAGSGGESAGTLLENHLAADGPENVIRVLDELEDEKFSDVDFVELNMCSGGCVGGVLTVENPYVAKARIKHLRKYRPVAVSHTEQIAPDALLFETAVDYIPVLPLAETVDEAMRRMTAMNQIADSLPGLDCGSCGAPSCRALAEDIVRGTASEGDCIFRLREHVYYLVQELTHLEEYIPPPFRTAADRRADNKTDRNGGTVS